MGRQPTNRSAVPGGIVSAAKLKRGTWVLVEPDPAAIKARDDHNEREKNLTGYLTLPMPIHGPIFYGSWVVPIFARVLASFVTDDDRLKAVVLEADGTEHLVPYERLTPVMDLP
jgi:hypothetical protein